MANPHPVPRTNRPNKKKRLEAAADADLVRVPVKEAWREYVNSGQFKDDLSGLTEARDRLKYMFDFARYIAPTLRSAEVDMSLSPDDDTVDAMVERIREIAAL